jgi:uncharacterized protein YndB with AHSA1/START domain
MSTQVYRVYIKASPDQIWAAITQPEWSQRYGYGGFVSYDLRAGGRYEARPSDEMRAVSKEMGNELPDVIIEGEVQEADPPKRLVTTFRMLMDEATAAEPASRITYEIAERDNGVCSLTLTHELADSPHLAMIVGGGYEEFGAGGGHAWVLSDLKTLLETGRSFAEAQG